MKAKEKRLRRRARLIRKALREENEQERRDRREEEARGWSALVVELERKCWPEESEF